MYSFKKIKYEASKEILLDGNYEDFDTVKNKYDLIYERKPKYGDYCRTKFYERLKKLIVDKNITSVLDIGTGNGHFCEWAYNNICKNVYGLDFASKFSQQYIDLGIKFIKAPSHEIPLPDKSIDLITSFDFMEHIHPDYLEETISEMKRVGRKYMCHKIAYGPSSFWHEKVGQLHLIQEDNEFWIDQVFKPAFSNAQYISRIVDKDNTKKSHSIKMYFIDI